jgi:hypothetical protein
VTRRDDTGRSLGFGARDGGEGWMHAPGGEGSAALVGKRDVVW